MTNTYLKKKGLESKYSKFKMSEGLEAKQKEESDLTQKMTFILKRMNSPKNFCQPKNSSVKSVHLKHSSLGPINRTSNSKILTTLDQSDQGYS